MCIHVSKKENSLWRWLNNNNNSSNTELTQGNSWGSRKKKSNSSSLEQQLGNQQQQQQLHGERWGKVQWPKVIFLSPQKLFFLMYSWPAAFILNCSCSLLLSIFLLSSTSAMKWMRNSSGRMKKKGEEEEELSYFILFTKVHGEK